MAKNNSKAMSETCVYYVDLVSSMKTDEKLLAFYKDAIEKLDFDGETLDLISECCEINSHGFLEIYIESENTKISNWTVEFPYSRKSWRKNGFEWELIYDESDDYYEDDEIYDEWSEESDW